MTDRNLYILNKEKKNSEDFDSDVFDLTPEPSSENTIAVPYSAYVKENPKRKGKIYDIYLYSEIRDPWEYTAIINTISRSEDKDIVNVFLNSSGGSYNTLCAFLQALESTNASFFTHITGEASSAAAILACAGDKISCYDFSSVFFHNIQLSSSGSQTDTKKILKEMINLNEIYYQMANKYCKNILTQQEIDDFCMNEKDLFFSGKNFNSRLKKIDRNFI
jgi:ATP-dependent protease ClpP protease subunit